MNRYMDSSKKDFYHYYATMMEPWDGPAAILFSDGDIMGAILDRNGLRPSRYYITDDRHLILSFRGWRTGYSIRAYCGKIQASARTNPPGGHETETGHL